jgi:hypothetical protein
MHGQNAAAEKGERIDPLKTIVGRDLLRMASDMYRLKQNEAYWENVPVPTRPLGKVRGETAFQVGVFALPVLAYFGVALHFGFIHSLCGLPLYYALFVVLEETLFKAIRKKRDAEEDLDRGRYAFTRILGERLGLKPEEVTLDVVRKLTADFAILMLYGRNMPQEMKDELMRQVYRISDYEKRVDFVCLQFELTKHLAPAPKKTAPAATNAAPRTSHRPSAAAVAAAAWDGEDASPYPSVNTMTGLPMMHNTPFDIGGNIYGTGTPGGFA